MAATLDRYRFSGEFHYFRVPRRRWRDRLAQVRDLGFDAVSIYVPWNWHEPEPGALDLVGRTLPERDLLGALDEIEAAGLQLVERRTADDAAHLVFAARVGASFELAFEGGTEEPKVRGGRLIQASTEAGGLAVLIVAATQDEVEITLGGAVSG